jgi:Domain of unknown function (DUF4304)
MPVSVTRACMAAVSKELARQLPSAGFRRQSPHLWREKGELIHVINLQASPWGTSQEGQFTINLAITNRLIYSTWTGKPFPSNPGAAVWPVQSRIGRVIGDHDHWWKVSDSTDVAALASSVVTQVRAPALDWFGVYPGLDALDAALAKAKRVNDVPGVYETQAPIVRAIISCMRGNTSKARELLSSAYALHKGKPFAETIEVIASRLKIDVA